MYDDGIMRAGLPRVMWGGNFYLGRDDIRFVWQNCSVDRPCYQDSTNVPPLKKTQHPHDFRIASIPKFDKPDLASAIRSSHDSTWIWFFFGLLEVLGLWPRHVFVAAWMLNLDELCTLSFQMRHPNIDKTDHTVTEKSDNLFLMPREWHPVCLVVKLRKSCEIPKIFGEVMDMGAISNASWCNRLNLLDPSYCQVSACDRVAKISGNKP